MGLFRKREDEDPNREIKEMAKRKAIFVKTKSGEQTNILTAEGKREIEKREGTKEISDKNDITTEMLTIKRNGRWILAAIAIIGTATPIAAFIFMQSFPWMAVTYLSTLGLAALTVFFWDRLFQERMPIEPVALHVNERYEAKIMENVEPGTMIVDSKEGDRAITLDDLKKVTFKTKFGDIRGWLTHYKCASALPEEVKHDSAVIVKLVNALMINREKLKKHTDFGQWMIVVYLVLAIGGMYILYNMLVVQPAAQQAALHTTTTLISNLTNETQIIITG